MIPGLTTVVFESILSTCVTVALPPSNQHFVIYGFLITQAFVVNFKSYSLLETDIPFTCLNSFNMFKFPYILTLGTYLS